MIPHGIELLQMQTAEDVYYSVAELYDRAPGDSPIEKLFATALITRIERGLCEFTRVVIERDKEELMRRLAAPDPSLAVGIQPQAQLDFGRVDFIVWAAEWDEPNVVKRWNGIIVECDGHAFHERTPEQAMKDRSRDRAAQAAGYAVFRFTGRELHRDPKKCATEVLDQALKGWGF